MKLVRFNLVILIFLLAGGGFSFARAQEADSLYGPAIAASYMRERMYDYQGAIDELNVLKPVNNYFIALRFAYLFSMSGYQQESLRYYLLADKLEEGSLETKLAILNIYYSEGAFSQAKRIANKILRNNSKQKEANLMLARLAMINLDYPEASFYLKKILKIWPSDADANMNMYFCLLGMHNTKKAGKILSDLKCLYPAQIDSGATENQMGQ